MQHKRTLSSMSVRERFYNKVTIPNDPSACWSWTGYHSVKGYGRINIRKVHYSAHRLSYMLHNGDIPDGHLIRHTCDNPGCVNPRHLLTGTAGDNQRDKALRDRAPRKSLTEEQFHYIDNMRQSGASYRSIAASLGINTSPRILAKRLYTWRKRNEGAGYSKTP